MNRSIQNTRSAITAAAGLAALAAAMSAGCGGGGGATGGPNIPTTQIDGVVQSASASPVSGAVVRFDNLSTISSTTDSSGRFALQAPTSQIADSSLWVYNATGTELATENLSAPTAEQVLTVGESAPGNSAPPPPPPLGGTNSTSGSSPNSGSTTPPPAPPI